MYGVDKFLYRRRCIGPLHAGAHHHHGSFGGGKDRQGFIDGPRGWYEQRGLRADRWEPHLIPFAFPTEHVHWDFQKCRSRIAGHGVPDRHFDVIGNAIGVVTGIRPFSDGFHHRHVVHFLQRTTAQVTKRTLAADHQDGAVGAPGVGDAGHTIGDPGARRQDGAAYLPGIQPAPGIGRMHGRLFVAHVYDLDTFVQTAIVNRHHVTAAEGENALHPRLF